MNPKTLGLVAISVLVGVVAYVVNRKAAIPMAPGGAAAEPHTGPGV